MREKWSFVGQSVVTFLTFLASFILQALFAVN